MDVTIKNVPEGCEEQVREYALLGIERFLESQIKIEKSVEVAMRISVDDLRVVNGLEKKYEKPVAPPKVIREKGEIVEGIEEGKEDPGLPPEVPPHEMIIEEKGGDGTTGVGIQR
jgi:hypothetical protein